MGESLARRCSFEWCTLLLKTIAAALLRGGCFLFCASAAAPNCRQTTTGSRFAGIVLVHFLAARREPCRDDLPALNRLVARSNGNIKMPAIAEAPR